MPVTARRGCGGGGACCWRLLLLASSALVMLAERAALLYCVGFYLWQNQLGLAGLTFALLLPGSLVQVLSFRWYRADGDKRICQNFIIHTLHLGIFKRLWDCSVCEWTAQGSSQSHAQEVMQHADASALRLLEVLLMTLPQTFLQTYTLTVTGYGLFSPVTLCGGVCLLSLSWALVLYSRACCLIRPGHLQMPPAALLCQLLWRAGMLAARFTSLALFTHTFGCWVIGVMASHWLIASLWLVCQQTDIYVGQWSWHVFNFILGGVHVFFFLNVKDGPSRFRMAGFYTVMLLENATLLLAASDLLTDASWDSLTVPTAVLCSFLLGLTSLILYYRFLHPKSTEITQGLCQRGHMSQECLQPVDLSFSLGDKSLPPAPLPVLFPSSHPSFSLSGIPGSLLEHPGSCGVKPDGECRHHHWLLIRLALKTSDLSKINGAYGAGGVSGILAADRKGEIREDGCVSTSESRDDTMAPLSDCREEFESVSEAKEEEDEDESLEMESPLESPASECKRSLPEVKSVFGDSPEPNYCPTESSSTLYFSADPQSPSSSSNLRLDRNTPFSFGSGTALETLDELSPITTDGGLHRDLVRGLLGRVGPCYTSTPRLNGQGLPESSVAHLRGPRRQVVLSRRGLEEDAGF
ncbi:XK-related protein 5a [Myxocyprinus asiaticus]|uniref:XK-related protein 5a n=1 Tax=Myxocyprinus asiaticus TaxID=70543 RepID=UPI002223A50E|nr:XK-related protein 5a [Myxocyprinus asiaticus]XP_051500299.1 XK-related protein 5a [Myxocyprinus asiaticus]